MDEIRRLVKKAVVKFSDITRAAEWAIRSARKLDGWDELADELAAFAIRGMVSDERHKLTSATKLEAGEYGGPAKVQGASKRVSEIATRVYFGDQYFIGGRTLSVVLGEELEDLATREQAIGDGHLLNAKFCRALQRVVPEKKSVREAVSDKKLRALFREVAGEERPGLAAAGD